MNSAQLSASAMQARVSAQDMSAETLSYKIDGKSLAEHLDTTDRIMDCQVTFFSCNLFHAIIGSSKSQFDFRQSFDVHLNKENVRKAGVSGGGASGELFMFSEDIKLILKTVSHNEFVVF